MTDKQIKFYNKFTPKEQNEKFGIIAVHFEPFEDMDYVWEQDHDTYTIEECQETLKEYWDSRRFLAACTFLENGKSCEEVAELLHYSSSFAFSKAFRRIHGQSPREYIKSKRSLGK